MSLDPSTLRTLAAADAASPPPDGVRITAATLQARAVAVRVRRGLAATLLLATAGLVFAMAQKPEPSAPLPTETVRELRAQLEALTSRIAAMTATTDAIEGRLRRTEIERVRLDAASEHMTTVYPLRARPVRREGTR